MYTNIFSSQNKWEDFAFSHGDQKYTFPIETHTGEIYNLDPDFVVRSKCAALTLLTPLTTAIRVCYWSLQAFGALIAESYRYLDGRQANDFTYLKNKLADIPRAIFYGMVLTSYAFAGIFAPRWARKNYGYNERLLNRHMDGPHRDKFYSAICFQRLAVYNCDDPEAQAKVQPALTKYVVLLESMRHALIQRDYLQILRLFKIIPAAGTT